MLGKSYPEIHRFMDYPSKYLGRRHRVVRHDLSTVIFILLATRDPGAAFSSLMHLSRDFGAKSRRR